MAHIVRTHEPHDLLALVPALVGFRPRNSLVLVVFKGRRTAGAYRVDLPAPASDVVYKALATTLIGVLCKIRGADGVVPVVYTDDSFRECLGIPRETFLDRLMTRAQTAGFEVKEALCVASDGWGSYFESGDGEQPRPLALIDGSFVHQDGTVGGLDLRTPEERAELPAADAARSAATSAALKRWRGALGLEGCDPVRRDHALDDARRAGPSAGTVGVAGAAFGARGTSRATIVLDDWSNPVGLAELALALDPATLDPSDSAAIVLAAHSPGMRDVLLFDWAWGAEIGRATLRLNLRFQRGEPTTDNDECALGLAGMGMPRPDPARIRRAIELLRRLASDSPATDRPPLLTMLAWLHWALGSGSTAGLLIDAARRIDSSYGLAELLDTMLAGGVLPEWAFERDRVDDEPPNSASGSDPAERVQ